MRRNRRKSLQPTSARPSLALAIVDDIGTLLVIRVFCTLKVLCGGSARKARVGILERLAQGTANGSEYGHVFQGDEPKSARITAMAEPP